MSAEKLIHVRRIAIIGGGPAGVTAAKYLLAERAFDSIDIIEQRDNVGGVWNYSPETGPELPASDPKNAKQTREDPIRKSDGSGEHTIFVSPMYDHLETNIPKSLMQHSDLEFPPDSQLFPQREIVLRYLEEYAKDVLHMISFETQVLDVRLVQGADCERWLVQTRDLPSNRVREAVYDAVIVASGHYDRPVVPPIPGLDDWAAEHPGSVIHSKAYRTPERFRDMTVIVVGNSASGIDIGAQVSRVCKPPLLVSQRSVSLLATGVADPNKEDRPEIAEFILKDRAVRFVDGTVEENIDAVLFCTGYSYAYPFLSSLQPAATQDGLRTEHVYQHIFYIPHPTLAFLALPQRIVPFIVAESQSAVVARVWAKRITLPTSDEMNAWEKRTIEELGSGKLFHAMNFPRDVNYVNELFDWSMQAEPAGLGKPLPKWGIKDRWIRERCAAMKGAFASKGDERYRIRTVQDLGYDPDDALVDQQVHRSVF